MNVLAEVERISIKSRNLQWKRIIISMRQGILNCLKQLKVQGIEFGKCSFEDFSKTLQKDEYFTIYSKKTIFPKLVDLIMETYLKNTVEQSCSSVNMTTTTTLCTTVPTTITPADAPPSSTLNSSCEVKDDFLDELLPVSTSIRY